VGVIFPVLVYWQLWLRQAPPVAALPVLIALLLPHPIHKDPNDG
jgi:hypothetical protein